MSKIYKKLFYDIRNANIVSERNKIKKSRWHNTLSSDNSLFYLYRIFFIDSLKLSSKKVKKNIAKANRDWICTFVFNKYF